MKRITETRIIYNLNDLEREMWDVRRKKCFFKIILFILSYKISILQLIGEIKIQSLLFFFSSNLLFTISYQIFILFWRKKICKNLSSHASFLYDIFVVQYGSTRMLAWCLVHRKSFLDRKRRWKITSLFLNRTLRTE